MNEKRSRWLCTWSDQTVEHILFYCGIFLVCAELYKQLFLYFIIEQRRYDWWYFPFQLCSLPMYLCLLLPFMKNHRLKTVFCTFMRDYNLMGGIAALLVPEGFIGIHWSLTLHGYLWHITLILIGLVIWISGRADDSPRGFARTLPVFALCCFIASFINVAAPGHGQADMFYISPYHPSTQIIFHALALHIGILLSNLLYLMTVCLGAFLMHCFFIFLHHALPSFFE